MSNFNTEGLFVILMVPIVEKGEFNALPQTIAHVGFSGFPGSNDVGYDIPQCFRAWFCGQAEWNTFKM